MDPRIVEEIENIRKARNGVVTPHDVVARAKDPANVLHPFFTWDDRKAAEAYRLWQARRLLKVAVTVVPGPERQVKAYVSLQADRKRPKGGYRATVDVLSDDDLREQLLEQALAELERLQERYKALVELSGVFAEFRRARDRVKRGRGEPVGVQG